MADLLENNRRKWKRIRNLIVDGYHREGDVIESYLVEGQQHPVDLLFGKVDEH